ncbi:hypothetical protein F4604DRAFT_1688614 [Suillus subluteus]|nr:hypothetical protein F4604DRAFT_1688614 [Suillus subluteus]
MDWDHSANGALLNTSDITWFHNADDNTLLPTFHMPLPSPAIMIAPLMQTQSYWTVLQLTWTHILMTTYQQTKEMGDADHGGAKQCKSDLTADIHTIFTCESNTINSDIGKEEDGHWCEVCKANGLAWKFSFLKGSITSLQAHIQRHKDHTKLYKN